jgi:ribosomal protein L37AE/L43A
MKNGTTEPVSIEGKHSYRFGYLKSEQWKNVRIEALAREKGLCQICGEESISNDAHHIWYPENIYETTQGHLVILCRPCHDFLHAMLPECKTNDEAEGRAQWMKFFNAVKVWRINKAQLFETGIAGGHRELRQAYDELRKRHSNMLKTTAEELNPDEVIYIIRQWAKAWEKTLPVDKTSPED